MTILPGLEIGLTDMGSVMHDPPFIVAYGDPGIGKSTAVAQAFAGSTDGQGALFLITNKQVLRPYQSWCEANRAAVEENKLRTLLTPNPRWTPSGAEPAYLPEWRPYDKGGLAVKHLPRLPQAKDPRPNVQVYTTIIDRFVSARAKGTSPCNGLVFDEGTEAGERWLQDFENDPSFGKNNFARWGALSTLIRSVCEAPRTASCAFVMICHRADPKFYEEDSPRRGEVQFKGGPLIGSNKLRGLVCGYADIVLRACVRTTLSGTERFWETDANPMWESKFRAFGIPVNAPLDLRSLLLRAGYRLD